MERSEKVCGAAGYCIWIGFALMSMALFLHPMNPEDFLALALFAPVETIRSAYGIQAAVLFWISMVLVIAGVAGLIRSIGSGQKPTLLKTRPGRNDAKSTINHTEENWSFL